MLAQQPVGAVLYPRALATRFLSGPLATSQKKKEWEGISALLILTTATLGPTSLYTNKSEYYQSNFDKRVKSMQFYHHLNCNPDIWTCIGGTLLRFGLSNDPKIPVKSQEQFD